MGFLQRRRIQRTETEITRIREKLGSDLENVAAQPSRGQLHPATVAIAHIWEVQKIETHAYGRIADILTENPDVSPDGDLLYAAASSLTARRQVALAALTVGMHLARPHDNHIPVWENTVGREGSVYDTRMLALARAAMPEYASYPDPLSRYQA